MLNVQLKNTTQNSNLPFSMIQIVTNKNLEKRENKEPQNKFICHILT